MDSSFGQSVLSLYTLVDWMNLSYGYSNREIPNEVRDFQTLSRSKLVRYIENNDDLSKYFLDLCIEHVQDICNDNFEFIQQLGYKEKL